eukprot:CAMPEP_0168194892 /NCGR_PEP_ID=MMETSP0139_2-20121125/19496_1 /TAXON_ID=44445 /ORGANISM="Pseudo-nitzschia australis, Strain 10249 10 AB" /LENGTH=94 /DNA_ID=CAMNT_0008118573 /DNA_START=172 /DNA_END=456 /DNA_ORIENTATION=+
MMNIDQTQALAGIVNRFRSKTIWGKTETSRNSRRNNSLVPVQVTMANQLSAEPLSSSSPLSNLPIDSTPFDADSYRRQMTDLVYQRNMKRMCNE